ncbi:hypothetical protein [Arthrobacter sp. MDT1-65]
MITRPGEYHDANSTVPIQRPQRTLDLIAQGRLMPPLPIQVALRQGALARILDMPLSQPATDAEAA